MNYTSRKPSKEKNDGWIKLFDLSDDEFFCLLSEIEQTVEMFKRFNDWKGNEERFKRVVDAEKKKK